MNRIRTASIAAFLSLLPPSWGLELSGQLVTRDYGEAQKQVLEFPDRGATIRYRPPEGWHVTGGKSGLELFDPTKPLSIARLKVLTEETPAPDGDSLEGAEGSYKRLAFQQLATGATEIVCVRADRIAPLIRKSFGVVYEYQVTLHDRRLSVVTGIWDLAPRQHEKLLAVLVEPATKPAEDLSPAAQTLFGSLFTWEEPEPPGS